MVAAKVRPAPLHNIMLRVDFYETRTILDSQ
jgi:hypothetical protein